MLLKPLVTLGSSTQTHTHTHHTLMHMHTLLANCVAQSEPHPVSSLSKNNVPIMSSKSTTEVVTAAVVTAAARIGPRCLTPSSFNVKNRGVFLFCISHRFSCQTHDERRLRAFSSHRLDMSVFPPMLVQRCASAGFSPVTPRPLGTPSQDKRGGKRRKSVRMKETFEKA